MPVFTYVGFVGSWQHPPDGWATVGVVLHLGVLFGATVLLPRGSLDPWATALSVVALLATVRWKLGVGWPIGAAAVLGGLRAVVYSPA